MLSGEILLKIESVNSCMLLSEVLTVSSCVGQQAVKLHSREQGRKPVRTKVIESKSQDLMVSSLDFTLDVDIRELKQDGSWSM